MTRDEEIQSVLDTCVSTREAGRIIGMHGSHLDRYDDVLKPFVIGAGQRWYRLALVEAFAEQRRVDQRYTLRACDVSKMLGVNQRTVVQMDVALQPVIRNQRNGLAFRYYDPAIIARYVADQVDDVEVVEVERLPACEAQGLDRRTLKLNHRSAKQSRVAEEVKRVKADALKGCK